MESDEWKETQNIEVEDRQRLHRVSEKEDEKKKERGERILPGLP